MGWGGGGGRGHGVRVKGLKGWGREWCRGWCTGWCKGWCRGWGGGGVGAGQGRGRGGAGAGQGRGRGGVDGVGVAGRYGGGRGVHGVCRVCAGCVGCVGRVCVRDDRRGERLEGVVGGDEGSVEDASGEHLENEWHRCPKHRNVRERHPRGGSHVEGGEAIAHWGRVDRDLVDTMDIVGGRCPRTERMVNGGRELGGHHSRGEKERIADEGDARERWARVPSS